MVDNIFKQIPLSSLPNQSVPKLLQKPLSAIPLPSNCDSKMPSSVNCIHYSLSLISVICVIWIVFDKTKDELADDDCDNNGFNWSETWSMDASSQFRIYNDSMMPSSSLPFDYRFKS